MKTQLSIAIKLTITLFVLICICYPTLIWGIAQLTSNHGNGFLITNQDKVYYENIGQAFTSDNYFWSRPSAVNYNAASSGGSNKGPSNPTYLAEINARIDTFLVHNPDVQKNEIPADLLTSSGSGLDPHISVEAAKIQVKRIAKHRNISEHTLLQLIDTYTEKPWLGLIGPSQVHVLKLNLHLNQLSQHIK